jgi:hypothetical protein
MSTAMALHRRCEGEDVAFLDRWGYDAEQRAAIAAAVLAVAEA